MNDTSTKQTRDRIWQIIKTINRTCMDGKGFDKLKPYFHNDVVMVDPDMATRAQGRDTCLKRYEDICSKMIFHKLDASDEHIDFYGQTAVACYKYQCVWEFQAKKFDDTGHEILVFVQDDKDWQVAWRTLIPGSRQIEKCPTEKGEAGIQVSDDIKQTCLNLITNTFICQLTTIDSAGFPHTSAMLNLRYAKEYPSLVDLYKEEENDFVLYMSTGMQLPKMTRMMANPKVCVYFCDTNQLVGLMLGGEIEIIADQKLKNRIWQKGWTMYYPKGPDDPTYGIIKLAPTIVKGWRNGPFEIKI